MSLPGFFTIKDGRKIYMREAFVEDAERLHEFYKKVTSETEYLITKPSEVYDEFSERQLIRLYRSQSNRLYIVAFYAAEIIGTLKLAGNRRFRVRHVAELSIAVLRDFQGLGVGSGMMSEALNWAKEHGIIRVELTVVESNKRAIEFYKKFGFEIEGRLKSYAKLSTGFVDAFLMAKFL